MMETTRRILPNNELLAEVIRLLNEGRRVTLPVRGFSMLPFIIGGRESVELVKPQSLAVGDVVLAWINGTHYVVHRIVSISADDIQLMGDGNLGGDERCKRNDVAGRAEYVVSKNGSRHNLYAPWRVRASRLWWKLRPVRLPLLRVVKLVYGIYWERLKHN